MLRHYKGSLGEFAYDDSIFMIKSIACRDALCYIGNEKTVGLPKGCINTRYMFCECKLTTGFSLSEDFDTSNVIDMTAMFHKCVLPDGFSMGPNFNTANVVDMTSMFSFCHACQTLDLGLKFDTGNVISMKHMFYGAVFTDSLILRDSFKTNKVEMMQGMFNKCVIGNKFRLGDCFDTSNVKDFRAMFYYFEFPVGFEFPRCFTTKNALIIDDMFYCAKFPDNFSLDIECNIKSGQLDVFENCYFPKGFSFGPRFSIDNDVKCIAVFDNCYVDGKSVNTVLCCKYAKDVVSYRNETYGGKYHKGRGAVSKFIAQKLDMVSRRDSKIKSEKMNLF